MVVTDQVQNRAALPASDGYDRELATVALIAAEHPALVELLRPYIRETYED